MPGGVRAVRLSADRGEHDEGLDTASWPARSASVPLSSWCFFWCPSSSPTPCPWGSCSASCSTLGRLSADNEVTAMRSLGVGFTRIARPVLFLGLVGALATLEVNFELMPHARVVYDAERDPGRANQPPELHRAADLVGISRDTWVRLATWHGLQGLLAVAARREPPGDPLRAGRVGPGGLRRGDQRTHRHPVPCRGGEPG